MKKRLILLLTISIIFINTFAQQSQQLKFMGKSMDCSMSEMVNHLSTKGCKIIDKTDNSIVMTGTFLGYPDCEFYLLEDHHILLGCGIILPDNYDLSSTRFIYDYTYVVFQYTQKYGRPQILKSDFEEISRYRFSIEKDIIEVSIKSNKSFYKISILYINDTAAKKIRKMQQDEI